MSLPSHRWHPLPLLFVGLSVAASAVEPAPPLNPALPGWHYSEEELALKPILLLDKHYSRLMALDAFGMELRTPGKNFATAEALAEHKKMDGLARAAVWNEISIVRPQVTALLAEPATKALATPAVEMHEVIRQADELYLQIFKLVDSGKPMNSPEVLAIKGTLNRLTARHAELSQQTMDGLKKVLNALDEAGEAGGKAPAPAPAVPATSPATITPATKSSKDELPPGMTRK